MRGTDKSHPECLDKYKYVSVWFIVGVNAEIVTKNRCCKVSILECTGSLGGGGKIDNDSGGGRVALEGG